MRESPTPVIIHSPLTIPNVMPQLERCWSESDPPLKLAMVRTVSKACLKKLELDDQNFHLLIPMILLGKCNDFSKIVDEAENTWKALENQSGKNDKFQFFPNLNLFCKHLYFGTIFLHRI